MHIGLKSEFEKVKKSYFIIITHILVVLLVACNGSADSNNNSVSAAESNQTNEVSKITDEKENEGSGKNSCCGRWFSSVKVFQ